MVVVVMGLRRGRLGLRRIGLLRCLDIALELRERALCLGQVAGGECLSKRTEIGRDRIVAGARAARGSGVRTGRVLRLQLLRQRGVRRLSVCQVAGLKSLAELRVVLLDLLRGAWRL